MEYTYGIKESIQNHMPKGDKSLRKMLVGVNIHSTLGRDKIKIPTVSKEEVSDVKKERINSQFNFFNTSAKQALVSIAASARNELAGMSFVTVDGVTFLSREAYPIFLGAFEEYKKAFETAKVEFLKDYDRAYAAYSESISRWVNALDYNDEDKSTIIEKYLSSFPSYMKLAEEITLSHSIVCFPTINESDLKALKLNSSERKELLKNKAENDIENAIDYVENELKRIALCLDRLAGKLVLIFNSENYTGAGYAAYLNEKIGLELNVIKSANNMFEVEQISDLIDEIFKTETMSTVGAMTELGVILNEVKFYYEEIGRTFDVKMKNL